MLVSTALVLLMTLPGLALFYGGLVRSKNMLSVLMQVFTISSLIFVLWAVYGYSVAFTEGNAIFGGFSKLFLNGVDGAAAAATFSKKVYISELIYVAFQGTFAAITCCLIVGAFAERMKFSAVLIFAVLWFTFSYLPMAHMVWYWSGPDAYVSAAAETAENLKAGWLFQKGALDFAGGTVVHINAGIAGLVAAYMLGKRIGYGKEAMTPHSLTLTMVGACMLWVGWFGFNAGSALEATGAGAGLAFANTLFATAIAVVTWVVLEWVLKGKPSMLGAVTGAVAGLVAITPAAGFVGIKGALAIGLIASAAGLWGVTGLKRMLGADDALDVFGVHGLCGIVGAILTGIFASPDLGGVGVPSWVDGKQTYDMMGQIKAQCIAVGTAVVWSAVVAFVVLTIVKLFVGLRVPEDEEREGLDTTSHGEKAYHG
jgi:ammonium transporter, Amt family